MTYFEELASAVDRHIEVLSGELVIEGTRVPVENLLDDLEEGEDVETFVASHPTVHEPYARLLTRAWEDIRLDTDRIDEVRCRLLAHADWALISRRVARHIDAELTGDPHTPDLETLVTWAHVVVQELSGGGAEAAGNRSIDRRREPPSPRLPSGRITDAIDSLTDAALTLRTAAETLQRVRFVHAAYARALADRADEMISDLRHRTGDR